MYKLKKVKEKISMAEKTKALVKAETTNIVLTKEEFEPLLNSPYFEDIPREVFIHVMKDLPAENQKHLADVITFMGGNSDYSEGDSSSKDPIPVAKLIQKTTADIPEEARPGDFVTPFDVAVKCHQGKNQLETEIVPLFFFKSRAMFNPGELASPICWSINAKINKDGMQCRECSQNPVRTKNKSNCKDQLQLICATADLSKIFRISFTRSSFMIGARFQNSIGRLRFPWSKKITLTSELISNTKGSWYVPKLNIYTEDSNPAFHEAYRLLGDMYRAYRQKQNESLDMLHEEYMDNRKNTTAATEETAAGPSVAGVGSDFDLGGEPELSEM